jgi:carbamoyl-phosphate synthase small subunit
MALLALEDGTCFEGISFGARKTTCGEICFNTGLTGYVEILTDPSYCGQIVTMTYPHIGNVGITYEDLESASPHLSALVVREASPMYSSWRADVSIQQYLEDTGVVGISEVDTRALTRHIREAGAMRACISCTPMEAKEAVDLAKSSTPITEQDLVSQVTSEELQTWDSTRDLAWYPNAEQSFAKSDHHIVAFNFGIKNNILCYLREKASRVTVVPASATVDQINLLKPNGIFLSNGPGDPEQVDYAVEQIAKLVELKIPMFGICLGHQLLGLALGAKSRKMKYGHRGSNQPVLHIQTGKIEITSHNHGYALHSFPEEVQITHVNTNDDCIEGFRHNELPIFGVQYHPEAAPGPHDSSYLFDQFVQLMDEYAGSEICQDVTT